MAHMEGRVQQEVLREPVEGERRSATSTLQRGSGRIKNLPRVRRESWKIIPK